MKIKTDRESNIELLRVFAMLMIILHHIIWHGFYPQLSNQANLQFFDNWAFTWPAFSKILLLPEAIAPFGKIANGIFVMVSGYFLIERGRKVKIQSIARKLLFQLAFACVVIVLFSFLICRIYPTTLAFGKPVGVEIFNEEWWFVGYYFIVITIGVFFLNERMCRLSKENYVVVLTVLFALFSFSWSGEIMDNLEGMRILCAGVFCYLWGGYCKKYNPLERVRLVTLLLIIVLVYILMWVSYYNTVHTNILYYNRVGNGGTYIQPAGTSAYPDYGIVSISLSIIIFELFRRIKIRPNAFINYISSASFMVYLIHDNEFIRNFWAFKEDLAALLYESPVQFCVKIGVRALMTYILGVVVFSVYRLLASLLEKYAYVFVKADVQSTTSL